MSEREAESHWLGLHTPVAFGADPHGFSVKVAAGGGKAQGRNAFLIMCCSLSALAASEVKFSLPPQALYPLQLADYFWLRWKAQPQHFSQQGVTQAGGG